MVRVVAREEILPAERDDVFVQILDRPDTAVTIDEAAGFRPIRPNTEAEQPQRGLDDEGSRQGPEELAPRLLRLQRPSVATPAFRLVEHGVERRDRQLQGLALRVEDRLVRERAEVAAHHVPLVELDRRLAGEEAPEPLVAKSRIEQVVELDLVRRKIVLVEPGIASQGAREARPVHLRRAPGLRGQRTSHS